MIVLYELLMSSLNRELLINLDAILMRRSWRSAFDEANTLKQDPFDILNAYLGYEFENYGIYVLANNIFDTRYV